jgi:phosphate transport system protein
MTQNSEFGDHISNRFNQDLEELRNNVLKMGGLVENQLNKAIKAITNGDSELGLEVVAGDEAVNAMENDIHEECLRILATRAPAAIDLRLIIAIIKSITDLERIGDESDKIGFLASKLAAMDRPNDSYIELSNLGLHVLSMLKNAMDAFARLDTEAAKEVIKEDEKVDNEYELIHKQGLSYMKENPEEVKRLMRVTWTARALERIGDHAKNISEYIIYMVEARNYSK